MLLILCLDISIAMTVYLSRAAVVWWCNQLYCCVRETQGYRAITQFSLE